MRLSGAASFLVVALCAATVVRAQGQGEDRELPVAGTLTYNMLFLSHPPGQENGGFGARFGGRFAIRAGPRTYVGVGVGSWAQAQLGECSAPVECGTFANYWSEAIVYQAYAQHSPSPAFPGWARLGAGIANTSTLLPAGSVIDVLDRWRAALTGGVGADLRVGGHVFVTPSMDYTLLPGVGRGGEDLRHALALGFGVTIR